MLKSGSLSWSEKGWLRWATSDWRPRASRAGASSVSSSAGIPNRERLEEAQLMLAPQRIYAPKGILDGDNGIALILVEPGPLAKGAGPCCCVPASSAAPPRLMAPARVFAGA